MSGYLSERYGVFNVVTQNVAFVHVDADEPRVFAGDDLSLGLTSFGLLPGTNYTLTIDFGDGVITTNEEWSTHRYAHAGTYAVHVVVTDNTGASATGTVSMAAYAPPALSGVSRPNFGDTATVSFPTVDGASYRLFYTDGLASPNWMETGNTVTGDGTDQSIDDSPGGSVLQRFYRLKCILNPTDTNP